MIFFSFWTWIEAARLHFLSDVFVHVAVVVAKFRIHSQNFVFLRLRYQMGGVFYSPSPLSIPPSWIFVVNLFGALLLPYILYFSLQVCEWKIRENALWWRLHGRCVLSNKLRGWYRIYNWHCRHVWEYYEKTEWSFWIELEEAQIFYTTAYLPKRLLYVNH